MADRFRGPRKEKQWGFLPLIQLDLTGDGTFGGSAIAFTSVQTVLRMLGEYIISPTGVVSAADSCTIVVGLAKVSTDAAAVGASALPDPGAEGEFPWLYWMSHSFEYPTVASGEGGIVSGSLRKAMDIRTMRKFRPGESLVWVVQYINNAGNPPMTLTLSHTRVLLTIH